ncbi:membrane protein [Bacillus sp. JCM 19047]|nr:membrane protein [Bacillus sp. JCM 19047]
MPKTIFRAISCVIVLALLLLAPLTLTYAHYSFSVGFLFLLVCCYAAIGQRSVKQLIYPVVVSIVIAAVYFGVQVFIRMDPVVLLFGSYVVQLVPSVCMALLLLRGYKRSIILVIGMMHGEVFVQIQQSQGMPVSIGSLVFWDLVALSFIVSISITWITVVIQQLEKRTVIRHIPPSSIGNRIDKHA